MKKLFTLLTIAGLLSASAIVYAESGHEHNRVGGPKGGRLLEGTQPRAEFFVEKDNMATVTFYDEALKPVAVSGQSVTVIAETGGKKSTVTCVLPTGEFEVRMFAAPAAGQRGRYGYIGSILVNSR